MKICYFGSYEKNYSRNKINYSGIKSNGVQTVDCFVEKETFKIENFGSIIRFVLFFPLSFLYRNLFLIVRGYVLFRKENYQVIIVGYPGHLELPAAFILKKIINKPIIFDSLTSLYDTFVFDRKLIKNILLSDLLFKFEKSLYGIPDCILVDTNSNGKFLSTTFHISSKKIRTLYVGAEDKLYKPTDLKRIKKNFTVMFYGYASPLHGIEYIIQAAKICQEKDQKIKFVLLGDGQTKQQNKKMVDELRLKNIEFLPSMEEKKASKVISNADVILGVFKGSSKSLRVIPNKVYQGIAVGKPVITQNSPAIREVFKDKDQVYLCSPADSESLSKAILKLKSNQVLRKKIAKNGHDLFLSEFTTLNIGNKFSQIINEVVHDFNFKTLN